ENLTEDATATAEVMKLSEQMSLGDPSNPPQELRNRLSSLLVGGTPRRAARARPAHSSSSGSSPGGSTSTSTTPSPVRGVQADGFQDGNHHLCATCGKAGDKLCSRCKAVYYCSVDCQRRGWSAHKQVCGH
ncbi:hypothetical protein FOZ62_031593, partial [Perkinsus olseni]